MAKAGIIDEMMSDTIDSAMDSEDLEEETEEQVSSSNHSTLVAAKQLPLACNWLI